MICAVVTGSASGGLVKADYMSCGVELRQLAGAYTRTWLEQQLAQSSVPLSDLVRAVKDVLARYDQSHDRMGAHSR